MFTSCHHSSVRRSRKKQINNAINTIRHPFQDITIGSYGCCWSLCVSGQAAAFQTMESHLKRTLCPKAIKTGRRFVGESLALWFASADDYTSLLYTSLLFPLCFSLHLVHHLVLLFRCANTQTTLPSLPFSFPLGMPVCVCACGKHKNLDIKVPIDPCGIICPLRAE